MTFERDPDVFFPSDGDGEHGFGNNGKWLEKMLSNDMNKTKQHKSILGIKWNIDTIILRIVMIMDGVDDTDDNDEKDNYNWSSIINHYLPLTNSGNGIPGNLRIGKDSS